jgi:hypothetical protein
MVDVVEWTTNMVALVVVCSVLGRAARQIIMPG